MLRILLRGHTRHFHLSDIFIRLQASVHESNVCKPPLSLARRTCKGQVHGSAFYYYALLSHPGIVPQTMQG